MTAAELNLRKSLNVLNVRKPYDAFTDNQRIAMKHALYSKLSIAVFAALSTLSLTLTMPSFAADANALPGKNLPNNAPRIAQPPAQATISTSPVTTLMPTKITQVKVSAASVMAGAPLEVRV